MSRDELSAENGSLGLPPEILVEIFVYCLPPAQIRLSKPPQLLPPFTLARVCSLWRNLVLSSPQLWNHINLGRYGTESAKEMEVLDYWLGRAGSDNVPLDIMLIPQADTNALQVLLDEEASAKYERDTTALTQRICANANRLRTLDLTVLDADVLEPLFAILGASTTTGPGAGNSVPTDASAPLLEELELTSMHLGGGRDVRVLTNIAHACPLLRSVTLMCPTLLPASPDGPGEVIMHNMRELRLRFCTAIPHVLAWLDVCPNLEHFKALLFCPPDENEQDPEIDEFDGLDEAEVDSDDQIDGEGWVVVDRPRPRANAPLRQLRIRSPVPRRDLRSLRHLTHLDLHCFSSPAAMGALLDSLDTPALRYLRVSSAKVPTSPRNARWLHVALLLHRSNTPLEELEIVGGAMNVDDVRSCLMLAPYLKRLSVGVFDELDALLQDLTVQWPGNNHLVEDGANEGDSKQSSSGPRSTLLCPRLEVLDVADATFSVDVLAKMVSFRFAINSSVPSGSESIATEICSLKELVVDTNTSQTVSEHALIAVCVNQGLMFTEKDPDILLSFRVAE